MTNETNYRTKANAVFFAAIMVVSMVAVGLPLLLLRPLSQILLTARFSPAMTRW